jgi:DNA-directed RNA polymerase specialized sigma24 family protein
MSEGPSLKQEWSLTRAAFDKLLVCFGPDRERAGEKYEQVRQKLTRFFEWRGCPFPEDYTDETINRVAKKIDEGELVRDPDSYCYSVARLVFMESLRRQEKEREAVRHQPPPPLPEDPVQSDRLRCLERCVQQIPPKDQELLTEYYQGEHGSQINVRQRLARLLELSDNALKIRACRLRKRLEDCIKHCLGRPSAG